MILTRSRQWEPIFRSKYCIHMTIYFIYKYMLNGPHNSHFESKSLKSSETVGSTGWRVGYSHTHMNCRSRSGWSGLRASQQKVVQGGE